MAQLLRESGGDDPDLKEWVDRLVDPKSRVFFKEFLKRWGERDL